MASFAITPGHYGCFPAARTGTGDMGGIGYLIPSALNPLIWVDPVPKFIVSSFGPGLIVGYQ